MQKEMYIMEHNKKMLDEIEMLMDNGEHSIFYSEATGLGKSIIFIYLVNKYFKDKKVLYIQPKTCIGSQLKHKKEYSFIEECDITMTCFANFNNIKKCLKYKDYDAVFVDEAHHLASDIQGDNILKLMKLVLNRGNYAFGMTATPIIEDKDINVADYFDKSVYGLNILEAIEDDLFPSIDYKIAIDAEELPGDKDVKKKYNIDSTRFMLKNVINQNQDITHWLAFFSNKKDLYDNKDRLEELFPEFKIMLLHSGMEGNEDTILDEFNNYDGKVILLSISKLLEGLHVRKVEGVLLYRNVYSKNTFLQIIGRICNIGTGRSPIFIDVTSSVYYMKDAIRMKNEIENDHQYKNKERNKKSIFNMVVNDLYDIKLEQYIDFILYGESITYRGITFIKGNKNSLVRALYKYNEKISINGLRSYINKHKDLSYKQVIDHYLDEYKQHNDIIIIYKNIEFIKGNNASIARALHNYNEKISINSVRSYISNHKNVSYEQVIDHYLDMYNIITYRGITFNKNNKSSLAKALHEYNKNVKKLSIEGYIAKHKDLSDEQIIDYYIDKHNNNIVTYRGITFNIKNANSLARALHKYNKKISVSVVCGYISKHKDLSYKQVIDRYLDMYDNKTYKGIIYNKKSLVKTICDINTNIKPPAVRQYMRSHKYLSDKQVIDHYLDKYAK